MRTFISYLFIVFLFLCGTHLAAQENNYSPNHNVLGVLITNEDTIPQVELRAVTVLDFKEERSKREQRKWDRTMRRVVKVYPYARVAGELMREYDRQLATLPTEKQRKAYLKMAENELKKEFEGEIRDMTVSEGYILIKLIDRETGNTSYDLIKELKGGFTAFMWQAVARIFGSNLKEHYDPEDEDTYIEEIVEMIEAGEIYVADRQAQTPEARARVNNKKNKKKDS